MRRHCLIAFSLANFCFFIAWREVLSPERVSYLYYWKQYPGYAALTALVLNVLLLASLFVAGFYLLRRFGGSNGEKVAQVIFLLVFVRAVNNIRAQFEFLSTSHIRLLIGQAGYIVAVLLVLSLIIFAIWRYGLSRVARGFALVLVIWSPFGLLGFAQATWWAVKYGRAVNREQRAAPAFKLDTNPRPRVVWLIFDEMDERLAFAARPPGLSLPAFDRLRAESMSAANAFPPAGHTSQSIPALLTGQLLSAVKPIGPGDLLLTNPANGTTAGWSEQSDIFSDARATGTNAALVGWYHPYCRVIGERLTSCQWEPASQRIDTSKLSFTRNLIRQDSDLLRLLLFCGTLRERLSARPLNYESKHLADYVTLMGDAENVVGDQNFGLVFIHLPVPHPPAIYNRARGNFSWQESSYLDNLALADRVVGELRQKMEQAGVWERTTLIVSSDHWWRSDYWRKRTFWSQADEAIAGVVDHRIPFIVKLAGQTTASQYDAAFNTVLTHDLVLEVLRGGISNQKDLAGWLDKHRTIGESPYQSYEDE
jgi:sulfatase-like protein